MAPDLRSISEIAAIWDGTAIELALSERPPEPAATHGQSSPGGLPPVVLVLGSALGAIGLSLASAGLVNRARASGAAAVGGPRTDGTDRWTLALLTLAIGSSTAVAAVGLDLVRTDSLLRSPGLLRTLDLSSRLDSVRVISADELRQIRLQSQPLEFDVAQLKQMPDPALVTLVADRTGRKPVVLLVTSRSDAAASASVARKLIQAGHQHVLICHTFVHHSGPNP
ncbi:MAG: hypothetical protein ACK4PI_12935 [Tepidisphaerales bacterium]